MDYKKDLQNSLTKQLSKEITLEIPPNPDLGDYSLPCFKIGNSQDIIKIINLPKYIKKAEIKGPYINFFIKSEIFAKGILTKILKEKRKFGLSKNNKKVVIEYPGPNTNKPLHLGHLRNMVLGISLVNLQRAVGNIVIPVDIINDRGIHIAKSALAYQKFGNNKKPDKKPDHFVGDFYVLFSEKLKTNPDLEDQAKELLKRYEDGDKKTIELFNKMNEWAIKGIKETYKRVGVIIKKFYFESKYYEKGKDIIINGLKNNKFKRDINNNIIVDLNKQGLGEKVLLRSDGTSIYITQDLYLAIKRYRDFKMDRMIYIVGSEQIYHFKALFSILEILGYKFAKNYCHLSYGMIHLPEGKMKSREGKIIDADDLLDKMKELSIYQLKKRYSLSKKELNSRSEKIAQAAIKIFLLKYDTTKDFIFYPEESLSFEGDTGPYLQYTYARANSLLKKAKSFRPNFNVDGGLELNLIKQLSKYPLIIKASATKYKPNLLVQYTLEIAHLFNEYYQKYPIIKVEKRIRNTRLTLVKATKQILENSLKILGIEVLNKM